MPVVASEEYPIPLDELRIRDPFVYAHPSTATYYLYAQTGNRRVNPEPGLGVEVYRSRDLTNWSEPTLVFRRPPDFWGGTEIWAPEMHALGGRYYLFVSFNGREGGRGIQILRADAPEGPFEVFSPEANTPPEQRCLDGTPWADPGGTCWLIYCHEWVQLGDGAMRAVRMRPDWSARLGEPIELFRASQAPWVTHLANANPAVTTNFVTDGPWLHRTARGRLLMLWSSFGPKGYTLGLARSEDGFVDGHWTHDPEPLFDGDGGHGMLFRTFEGQLKLVLHQPNHGGQERARFFDLAEEGERVAGYRDNSGDHGAPKILFDDATRQYLITWHSSLSRRHPVDTEAYWRGQRTLFITSATLENFSAPARLFPWELATIDVIVRRENGHYVAFIKDEALPSFAWPTGKSIRVATAPTLTGPWSEPSPSIPPNFREAPTVIPRPDGLGSYLYTEQYPGVQYTLATAPQLEGPWHEIYVGDYSVPPEARHGSMIPLHQPEYDALLATYGTP